MVGAAPTRAASGRQRLRPGLLLLCLAALLAAVLGGAGMLAIALERAEDQFEGVLDEKALSRALRVRRDLELALGLGIPLAEIRGMWEYTGKIPEDDPDIRFVAVSGPDLQRLHYGGIGRERLDPLLAAPALQAAAQAAVVAPPATADAVDVGDFSVVTVALGKPEAPAGFVHVGVQRKQLRERLYAQAGSGLPVIALALLLVLELAALAYAAGFGEPLRRLERLLESAERPGQEAVELSGRHAGGELGAAMFRFNALIHRVGHRTTRFLGYAEEVRRAVFEPAVAAEVAALAARDDTGGGPLVRRLDARPSDLRPALVLGLGSAVALAVAAGPAGFWLPAALCLAGLAAAWPLPAALCLAALPLLPLLAGLGAVATHLPAPALTLALGSGLLAGLALRYAREQALRLGPVWLALRLVTALAAGLLAALALEPAVMLPLAAAGALLLGCASLLLRTPVRRLLLAGRRGVAVPASEGG